MANDFPTIENDNQFIPNTELIERKLLTLAKFRVASKLQATREAREDRNGQTPVLGE